MRKRLFLAAVIAAAVILVAADEPNFSTWDANGGGADHSQYSSIKQINKNNVKQLEVAWKYESGNNPTFNPVIVDGMMYVGAQNAVVAIDARDRQGNLEASGQQRGPAASLTGRARDPQGPSSAVRQRGRSHRHQRPQRQDHRYRFGDNGRTDPEEQSSTAPTFARSPPAILATFSRTPSSCR